MTPTNRCRAPLRALLPFSDDSTLFFAQRMAQLLAGSGIEAETAWLVDRSDLSPRQLSGVLPEGPDLLLRNAAFKEIEALTGYDMLLTSRIFPPLRDMLRAPHMRHRANRPAVMAFQGGLEFDPMRGFFNRRHSDAVFVIPRHGIDSYRDWAETQGLEGRQYLGFGHPTFLRPEGITSSPNKQNTLNISHKSPPGDVYFFTQAISPMTRNSRIFMVRVLAAIARANPDRKVWLKLRHMPNENTKHLHREAFPYPDLMDAAGAHDLPNLGMTAEPMDEVLPKTGIGLTCTSTAAIDLVRAGVPTLIYLDYVEAYCDGLVSPMRDLFAQSGLIAPLEQVLALTPAPPSPDWMAQMFCTKASLIQQVFEAYAHFKARPDLVTRVLPAPTERHVGASGPLG